MDELKKPVDSAAKDSQPAGAGSRPAVFVDEWASYASPMVTGVRKHVGEVELRRADQVDKGLATETLMRLLKS
jgi:hypothetical protein